MLENVQHQMGRLFLPFFFIYVQISFWLSTSSYRQEPWCCCIHSESKGRNHCQYDNLVNNRFGEFAETICGSQIKWNSAVFTLRTVCHTRVR